jgi:type I restriction enzyme, S subunit
MNPAQLLEHFHRIADAPDAIPRLRRFILDLAVRGKLVPQDPKDEPATELLKRIAEDKTLLAKNNLKKSAASSSAIDNGAFLLPAGWIWTTLGELSNIVMGHSPPGDTYNTEGKGVPLINGPVEFSTGAFGKTLVNQYTTAPTNLCNEGDLLLCVRGSTTGRTNIAGFRACIGRGVAAIQPCFKDDFVRLFIWNSRDSIINMGRGIAFPSVSRRQIENLEVPLPPLVEQRRIVAKVDELMALCDRLEEAQAKREARRDRVTAVSLARLNAPDPDSATFQAYARFALNQLPRLTARPHKIKQLRQTILNLAVHGRLVPQNPTDEPASELLKRIASEKARRLETVQSGTDKQRQLGIHSKLLFDIPISWQWTTLGALARSLRYGTSAKCSYEATGVPVLRIPNVEDGRINTQDLKFGLLPERETKELRLQLGDILIVRSNGSLNLVGRPGLVESHVAGYCYAGYLVRVRPMVAHLDAKYLILVLNSAHVRDQIERPIRTTVGLKNVNASELSGLTIPLPPVAEQRRIVAKVDQLMALCDRLEQSLTAGDDTRRRLLESVLHHALAPAEASVMETAA